jgi:hypothetical protein
MGDRRNSRHYRSNDEEATMRKKRPRRSEKQWSEICQRFETSDLGLQDFCRREELTLSSLQRWRRQLKSGTPHDFVELVPATPARTACSNWSLDVALPNGASLRFEG